MTKSGAIIMAAFAAIWWTVGVHLWSPASPLLYGVALTVAGVISVVALRTPAPELSPDEKSRRGRLVAIASGAEGLAIFVVVNILVNIGRPDLSAAAVALIVGLHFLPLAWKLPAPLYYGTAACLLLLGLGGTIPNPIHLASSTECFAAALVLWATSAIVLWRADTPVEVGSGAT